MPCRSDYMEPNQRERRLQETAQLLGYVLVETGQDVPGRVADAANNAYCTTDLVPDLCAAIRAMDAATLERVVYNARDRRARRLADWWEEHEEADRQRELAEAMKNRCRSPHVRKLWETGTQTMWPRDGDFVSVSAHNIESFVSLLLDNPPKVK